MSQENAEEIDNEIVNVEGILGDFFLKESEKTKIIAKDTDSGNLNVEGILADFFLNKMERQKTSSDNDSSGKRNKKHKKHKSKKSKSKHKKSRSCSSERKVNYVKNIGDDSSSEEKELQRLQKLKKIDVKDYKHDSFISNNHKSDNDVNSDKHNIEFISNPSIQTGVPYGLSDSTSISGKVLDIKHDNEINPKNCQENKNMTDDFKNSISPSALPIVSEGGCLVKEENYTNKGDLVAKDKASFENKNIALHSSSRSSSSSGDEKKVQANKSETEQSSSKLKHKSRHRKTSHSGSKKRERSRHRSKESRESYEEYSHRKQKLSDSRKHHKSHSRSSSSDRSVSRSRYRRSRSRSKSYDYYRCQRSRSNSKSRRNDSKSTYSSSKSQDKDRSSSKHHIDQAKILQLAQKNVLNMIEKGTLPQGLSVENFKREQLVSLKSGGKSVQELTDFCMKLSKKENDLEEENDMEGNSRNKDFAFIHHPFKVKESSTIKMNIKNAVQIPIKTHAEKVAETARLSSQFPVSSGNQHKQKELEWVPVVPSTKNVKLTGEIKAVVPVPQVTTALPLSSSTETNIKDPNIVKPASHSSVAPSTIPLPPIETTVMSLAPPPLPPTSITLPPLPISTVAQQSNQQVTVDYTANSVYNYFVPQPCNYSATVASNNMLPLSTSSLPQVSSVSYSLPTTSSFRSKRPVDVASIVTKRFKALTKLQSNPNDFEALNALQEAQANIQNWVESQQVPGLFTGTTGAKPLSVEELSGPKHWNYRAKKDIFTRAAPVTEGKGMSLLKKMGWNPGEGLGKNKEGSLEPLVLDIKTDKRGLVSEGEGSKRIVSSVLKELQGKHPVSALMELCSKRKWKPPLYTLVQESGPPHKRVFLFKVEVNNVEYQSANPVNNKKVAKADAAVICLQALSIFPKS